MKKLLPSLLVLALLGACSHKNDADDGAGAAAAEAPVNEAAQRAEEERSVAETNAAEQNVAARYAKALLPLLAGSFGGACQITKEGGKDGMSIAAGSAKDKIEVGADGVVTAPGFEHDLNKAADGLSFTRMFEGGKPSTALATAGGTEPDWSFVRNSADQENVRLSGAGTVIGCNGSAAPLRDRPLWPLVTGFFRDGTSTGSCSAGGLVRSAQTIKIDADGVTVGGHSYAFGSGLQLEMVIAGGGKGLHYSVAYADGKKFNIMLDGSGHFAALMAAGEGGVEFDCARPAD